MLGVDISVAGVSEHDWMVTGLVSDQFVGIGEVVDVQVTPTIWLIFYSLEIGAA